MWTKRKVSVLPEVVRKMLFLPCDFSMKFLLPKEAKEVDMFVQEIDDELGADWAAIATPE